MKFRPLALLVAVSLSLLGSSRAQTTTPTPNVVIVGKADTFFQNSAGAPVPDPRPVGSPEYGQRYQFRVSVFGDGITNFAAPVITLAAGSTAPTVSPLLHNGGVLVNTGGDWGYALGGAQWATNEASSRDTLFANGTYTLNAWGSALSLNLATTAFPPNPPQLTLTGGTWKGGKFFVDVNQPLTVTSNAFTNYGQNANGIILFSIIPNLPDELDVTAIHSANPLIPTSPATDSLTSVWPAGTFVSGQIYQGEANFISAVDQVAGAAGTPFANSFNIAVREQRTGFTLVGYSGSVPQAVLYGVGDLPGGVFLSEVRDATKTNGAIYAVGDVSARGNNPDTAFIWTSTGGMTALPDLVLNTLNTAGTQARAITPNGAFIASQARVNSTLTTGFRGVRIASNTLSVLNLTSPNAGSNTQVSTISSDGSILYGNAPAVVNGVTRNPVAVRYSASPLAVTTIPFLNPTDDSNVPADRGASANGAVVVGRSTNIQIDTTTPPFNPNGTAQGGVGLGNQAFRYVHGTGVSGIPFIAGGTWSGAVAVTSDGNLTLVRGDSASAPQGEYYTHDATTGQLRSLGTPNGSRIPGGITGISADGAIVAGPFNVSDNPRNVTYIHNAQGWHDFQTMVEKAGVNLAGWDLRSQTMFGVSPDGTLVWGRGLHNGNREGWVVEFDPGYLANYTEPAVFSTPGAAIVGAWTVGDTTLPNDWALLIFFSDGYYTHVQLKDIGDPTSADGFERGQFTWDPVTGVLKTTTLLDTNGDTGLSGDDGGAGIVVQVNGNTATATTAEGSFTLNRVVGASPIIGAFGNANLHDASAAAVFLPNGRYVMAQDGDSDPITGDPSGHDGIEYGTYAWNAATGVLTTTALVDTNGQWGFSHPSGTLTIGFSPDLRTLLGSDNSGSYSAPRVGAAPVSITLGNLAQAFDGGAKSVTVTTYPTGVSVAVTYDGSTLLPFAIGSYAVVATVTDANYYGSATGTLNITRGAATVDISATSQTYNGTPRPVSVTTVPAGLNTVVTYDGGATVPSGVGSYAVVATVNDANYDGTATGTLIIGKATATVNLSNLSQTFDGAAKPVSLTTVPAGLDTVVTYDGSTTVPSGAGTYAVVATVNDANYNGSASGSLIIGKAAATVTLSNLSQIFDGTPKPVTVTTSPAGLNTVVTYNGSTTVPSGNGTYAVAATVVEANYQGSASGTLTIVSARPEITTQPANTAANVGSPASFTVVANSVAPITYQWKKGNNDIPGATSSTYLIPSAQLSDAANYKVVVTAGGISVSSNWATLTVTAPPTIVQGLTNQTVKATKAATFSVTATGTTPLTYQWLKKVGASPDFVVIAGETGASLSLKKVTAADAGSYKVVVSNAAGSVSSTATLIVQ